MKREDIRAILEKIGQSRLTAEEEGKVQRWLLQLNQQDDAGLSEEQIRAASREMWLRLNGPAAPRRVRRLWPAWVAAASVAIALITAGVWYVNRPAGTVTEVAANDIAPGRDGATLTLADGTEIAVHDALTGNIAQQSGVTISKDADGNLIYEVVDQEGDGSAPNTLRTVSGEQAKVRLPDGTTVALNAESMLRYPASFPRRGERRVTLAGEGYFQVAEDAARPFVVETDGQQVEVLGTHFNINTYQPGQVITTLEEGAVKVSNGTASRVIRPGEQVLNSGSGLYVQQADLAEVLGWKDGNFVFNGADISAVMHQLERWYTVEAVYEGPAVEGLFYANISRNQPLSAILGVLEKTKGVHFKIEGRRVMVSR